MKKKVQISGLLLLFLISLIFPLIFSSPDITTIALYALLFACAATGWNLFSGYTGYISLGYGTYYGLGAYSLVLLCQSLHIPAGYLPFFYVPVAGLIVACIAVPLGWVSLRARGHNFVIITIATIFVFQLLAYNLGSLTQGNSGVLFPIPNWDGSVYNLPFYYVALVLMIVSIAVSWWIRHSKYGLGLLAIRDDEERAQSLGIKVGAYKLTAFVISAFFGGMMGAVVFYYVGSVYPASAFDPTFDILPALMSFSGGIATVAGPVFGALVLEPLQQFIILQFGATGLDLVAFGILLIVLIFTLPQGVIPAFQQFLSKRLAARETPVRDMPIQELQNALPITLGTGDKGSKTE